MLPTQKTTLLAVLAGHGETVAPFEVTFMGLFGLRSVVDVVVDESPVCGSRSGAPPDRNWNLSSPWISTTGRPGWAANDQGGLARAGRTRRNGTGQPDCQVGEGPFCQVLDITRFHVFRAGFWFHRSSRRARRSCWCSEENHQKKKKMLLPRQIACSSRATWGPST